jgi:hypothetical protein
MSSEENGIVRYEKKMNQKNEMRYVSVPITTYQVPNFSLFVLAKGKKCAYATGLNASI